MEGKDSGVGKYPERYGSRIRGYLPDFSTTSIEVGAAGSWTDPMMSQLGRWIVLLASVGVTGYGLYAYFLLEPGTTVHPAMKATYAEHPWRILLHVGFSAIALLVGPFQFFPALRRRVKLHRVLGFIYFGSVLVGGVAGFFTSLIAFGGIVSHVGFGLLSVVWLWSGWAALQAIKARDFKNHELWALRCFALTFAAVTLRIQLGSFFAAGWEFEAFYPLLAWSCWVPNLIFVEWVMRRPA